MTNVTDIRMGMMVTNMVRNRMARHQASNVLARSRAAWRAALRMARIKRHQRGSKRCAPSG